MNTNAPHRVVVLRVFFAHLILKWISSERSFLMVYVFFSSSLRSRSQSLSSKDVDSSFWKLLPFSSSPPPLFFVCNTLCLSIVSSGVLWGDKISFFICADLGIVIVRELVEQNRRGQERARYRRGSGTFYFPAEQSQPWERMLWLQFKRLFHLKKHLSTYPSKTKWPPEERASLKCTTLIRLRLYSKGLFLSLRCKIGKGLLLGLCRKGRDLRDCEQKWAGR
jgi:hypothetical protein